MKKTIGNMIDELTIINLKIWALEDVKRESDDNNTIAGATKKTNILNTYRNKLIAAIDADINQIYQQEDSCREIKLYGKMCDL